MTRMKNAAYQFVHFCRWSTYTRGAVVEHGILDHGGEDKQEADGDKQVHRCHIGDSRQRIPGHCAQCGHGQHGGNA